MGFSCLAFGLFQRVSDPPSLFSIAQLRETHSDMMVWGYLGASISRLFQDVSDPPSLFSIAQLCEARSDVILGGDLGASFRDFPVRK